MLLLGSFIKIDGIGTPIPTAQTLEQKFDDQVFYLENAGINNIQA